MNFRFLSAAICGAFCNSILVAQISFSNQTTALAPIPHYSGVAIAVLDMNGDGRDDIVRMDQGNQLAVEYQTAAGVPFLRQEIGNISNASQWGVCAGDLTGSGRPAILTGGDYDGIKIAIPNGASFSIAQINAPQTFVQGVNMADINHDGWLDAFVCHDDGPSRIFLNNGDGSGSLIYSPAAIDLSTFPPSDDSGNYGSVWSDVDNDGDLDLYIAKCRQGVTDPADGRRINQLFLNNGDGTYTQDTTNWSGLRIGAQSWTADFGDMDNDGDFDCFVTNHDQSSQLLENDGTGHFTDITASAGLLNAIIGLPIQGVFRDFDNDGFVDILVSGTQHILFRNNGNRTFTSQPILDNNQMESFALGDLNHDGFQDIYAGYAEIYTTPSNTPDAIWINEGNANHFFGLTLRGATNNRSAIGAKAFLFSSLGKQVREVRSGESYGINNSFTLHFGLGNVTEIDSIVVLWPSGTVDKLVLPPVDQYRIIEEGKCTAPPVQVVAEGNTVFCSGDSVQLKVVEDLEGYAWSTGDTTATIWVSAAGIYAVTATNAQGCTAVSNYLSLEVDPVQTPAIEVLGDTIFCLGESVTLTASPSTTYLWNTGDTTASVVVASSGTYSVRTQGLCAQFESVPVQVSVLEPALPIPVADTVAPNAPAILSASGDKLIWHDAATGGNQLFVGNPFVTPPLPVSTTYWVANKALFDTPNVFTGMSGHSGSNFAGMQTNGAIIFDCYTPFKLLKVKVYTNRAGIRQIDLRTSDGTVLQSTQVNIPVGTTVITLDMDIPVGTDLALTTDEATNEQSLGSAGPQLRRSDQDVSYPYEIPGYLSIKSSNLGTERYYYFYDWEVDFYPVECLSERVPVTAHVDSTLSASEDLQIIGDIRILPNPAFDMFFLEWARFGGGDISVVLRNAQGHLVRAKQLFLPEGGGRFPILVSDLPSGLYWVEVHAGSGSSILRKLVLR